MKSHGCSLDCFGCCKFNVNILNNEIKIEGDRSHPYTKGLICQKGLRHYDRLNDPDRIYTPRKKVNGKWIDISFIEAIDIISERLLDYKDNYDSSSVMHYSESGSGSILKGIEDIFFNFYGGITTTSGGTCWSAGSKAQSYDFGYNKSSFIDDILHSKNIIFWSKNPANSHIHALDRALLAKKRGAKLIVIDPIYTDTAKKADIFVQLKPNSDAALAMAITKIILQEKLHDTTFIEKNIIGFDEYKSYLDTLDIDVLCSECGVAVDTVRLISNLYAKDKYSSIHLGYGLQRYESGGNSVRAIDALASITGSIGKQGGGVHYSNKVYPRLLNLDPYNSSSFALNSRELPLSTFDDFSRNIKAIFVTKANPLNQWPNLNSFKEAFKNIEFKVCIDMFMTDTAKECDLFIPCTNTLETEDLLYSSMSNPYIIYSEKCIEPKNILMDEYYFFMKLAKKMNIANYPYVNKRDYLQKIVAPLNKFGVNLDAVRDGYITMQEGPIAWEDLKFETPSGKIEIYSQLAKSDGLSPMPVYTSCASEEGTLRLLTTHPKHSLMSQDFKDAKDIATAYISPNTAKANNVCAGDIIKLKSSHGEIKVRAFIDDKLLDNLVSMNIGWWEKSNNPNYLTPNTASDMGGQICYYDCFVTVADEV